MATPEGTPAYEFLRVARADYDQALRDIETLMAGGVPSDPDALAARVTNTLKAVTQSPCFQCRTDREVELEALVGQTAKERDEALGRETELAEALVESQAQVRDTNAALIRALQDAARTTTVATKKKAAIPTPKEFTGDRETYQDFKDQLQAKLAVDGGEFEGEQHKLRFACNLLRGDAAAVTRTYRKEGQVDLASVDELWTILDQAYDDPDRVGTAERAIEKLREGRDDFAKYWATFLRLKAELQWGDEALMAQFCIGTSTEIRQAAISIMGEKPRTLNELGKLFNELDIRLRQFRAEETKAPAAPALPRPRPDGSGRPSARQSKD